MMCCFNNILGKKILLLAFIIGYFVIPSHKSFAQYVIKSSNLIADYEVEIGSPFSSENPDARCFVYAFQKFSSDDIALYLSRQKDPNRLNKSVIICNDCIYYDKSFQVNKNFSISPEIYITPLSSRYHQSISFYIVDNINLADLILVVPPDILVNSLAGEILLFDLILKNYDGGIKKPLEEYFNLSKLYDAGKITGELTGYKSKLFEGKISEISKDYIVLEDDIILKLKSTFSSDLRKGEIAYLYFNGFYWEITSDSRESYEVEVLYYSKDIHFKDCVRAYLEVANPEKGLIRDIDTKIVYSVDPLKSSLFLQTFLGGFGVIVEENKLIIEDLLNNIVIDIQRTKKRK